VVVEVEVTPATLVSLVVLAAVDVDTKHLQRQVLEVHLMHLLTEFHQLLRVMLVVLDLLKQGLVLDLLAVVVLVVQVPMEYFPLVVMVVLD
jgi:hypothetical protein